MKVLVTGGAGYVGSTVASACHDQGLTPVILDNLVTGRREFTDGRIFYEGDIADSELLDRIFREHPGIQATLHCAGLTGVGDSVARPHHCHQENTAKTVLLAGHLLRNACRRMVFASTAAVYSAGVRVADEDSPLSPASPFATSKRLCETALKDIAQGEDLAVAVLRHANPIGADPQMRSGPQHNDPTDLLGCLLHARDHHSDFTLTGTRWDTRDGTGERDYLHVYDLALAYVRTVQRLTQPTGYTVINVSTGKGTTVREMVEMVEMATGDKISVTEAAARPGDAAGCRISNEKAVRLLGWAPRRTVEQAIVDGMRWQMERQTILN